MLMVASLLRSGNMSPVKQVDQTMNSVMEVKRPAHVQLCSSAIMPSSMMSLGKIAYVENVELIDGQRRSKIFLLILHGNWNAINREELSLWATLVGLIFCIFNLRFQFCHPALGLAFFLGLMIIVLVARHCCPYFLVFHASPGFKYCAGL